MEEVRSFIAIELPEALRAELSRLQAQLRSASQVFAKWVDPSGIHLTLKFLGYVPEDRLGEITLAMEVAAEGFSPFKLAVNGLGAFPNLDRVQVVWVGLTGEVDTLARLVQRIESELSALGYPSEPRPFAPHLTLARMENRAMPDERRSLGQAIARTRFEPSATILVGEISLMRSQLTRAGAIYTRISSLRLG